MNNIKIYLDDTRPAPEGYLLCSTPRAVIDLLTQYPGQIDEISLDHDLGIFALGVEVTGYDVLLWLESNPHFAPDKINVHSANTAVWLKMKQAIASIKKRKEEYKEIGELFS